MRNDSPLNLIAAWFILSLAVAIALVGGILWFLGTIQYLEPILAGETAVVVLAGTGLVRKQRV